MSRPVLVGMLPTLPVIGVTLLEGSTSAGEAVIVLIGENRDRVLHLDVPVEKQVLERFHLESFRADHVLRFGEAPFDRAERGADPPDFDVRSREGLTCLDCVVFGDHDRRSGFHLMEHLRGRLVEEGAQRNFSGIQGCIVSVWFGPTISGLPPKRWDQSIVEPLLDAMEACHVDHDAVARLRSEVADKGFPEVFPPVVATGSLPENTAGFVANAVLDPAAGRFFPNGLGFDVELNRQAEVTASSAAARLARLVDSHDKPGIEWLLVTAGGPDSAGFRYPGEEAIAGFLARHPTRLTTVHLKKVTMHLWSARQIFDVSLDS